MSAPTQLVEIASPALVQALGWALLHSLWQGAVLALGASLLLMLLHRHAAAVRYRVSAAALVLLLALAGGTFGYYYRAALIAGPAADVAAAKTAAPGAVLGPEANFESAVPAAPAGSPAAASAASGAAAVGEGVGNWLATGRQYFEQNLPLLVLAWLLGMLAMTLRFLGGLAYVQRLRHYRVAALPEAWQARLDKLAARAGLRRRVRLLASALVPGPLVVGWLRPVVLLPLSAATGLSNDELEAILAHELAHVRRHDYLLNLLQSVAEILFFYHPAVWFLSASLRTERENCCDDLATELCGDPVVLARALATLAALSLAPERTPQLAMAAGGPAGSLLGRVRRLVRPRAEVPTFLEGFGAACVVLAGSAVLVVSTMASLNASPAPLLGGRLAVYPTSGLADLENAPEADPTQTAAPDADPAAFKIGLSTPYQPGDTLIVIAGDNAETQAYRLSQANQDQLTVVALSAAGDIRAVYINGRKATDEELPAYRAALAARSRVATDAEEALTQLKQFGKEPKEMARLQRMNEVAQHLTQQALAGDSVSDADAESLSDDALAAADFSSALTTAGFEKELQAQVNALRGLNLSLRQQLRQLETQPSSAAHDQLRQALKEKIAEVEAEWQQAQQRAGVDSQRGIINAGQLLSNTKASRSSAGSSAGFAQSSDLEDAMVAEMRRDGLISDPDNYTFSLGQKEFIVNGRPQPAAILSKYSQLYAARGGRPLKSTGHYVVTRSGTSTSTTNGRTTSRSRDLRGQLPPLPPVPPVPRTPQTSPAPLLPSTPSTRLTDASLATRRAEQRRQQDERQRQEDERQRQEDERQRTEDEQQRRQDEVQRQQDERQRERDEAQRRRDEAQRQQDERVRQEVMAELRRDGLIEEDAKSFSLQLRGGKMSVNNQPQSAALAAKYYKLLRLNQKPGQTYQITVNSD